MVKQKEDKFNWSFFVYLIIFTALFILLTKLHYKMDDLQTKLNNQVISQNAKTESLRSKYEVLMERLYNEEYQRKELEAKINEK